MRVSYIKCLANITAAPGEGLVIINDCCVGVISAEAVAELNAEDAPVAETATFEREVSAVPSAKKLHEYLMTHGPSTNEDLKAAFGIKTQQDRFRLSSRLCVLQKQGKAYHPNGSRSQLWSASNA